MIATEKRRDITSPAELADPPVLSKSAPRNKLWGAGSVTDIPGLPALRLRLCILSRAQSPHQAAPPAPLIGHPSGEPIRAWHNGTQLRSYAVAKLILCVRSWPQTSCTYMKQLSISSRDKPLDQDNILQHPVRGSGRSESQAG